MEKGFWNLPFVCGRSRYSYTRRHPRTVSRETIRNGKIRKLNLCRIVRRQMVFEFSVCHRRILRHGLDVCRDTVPSKSNIWIRRGRGDTQVTAVHPCAEQTRVAWHDTIVVNNTRRIAFTGRAVCVLERFLFFCYSTAKNFLKKYNPKSQTWEKWATRTCEARFES